ncbi:MAG: hypothetical protein ACE15C_07505 [Phycisphaerae bacterium]
MCADNINIGSDADNPLAAQADGGPSAIAPRKRPASAANSLVRDNLLLVGLFAAGIAVIYILRLRGGPAAASAEQVANERQVETAVASLAAHPITLTGTKGKAVMEGLEARPRQIPLERLRGNPFTYRSPAPAVPPVGPSTGDRTGPRLADPGMSSALGNLKQFKLQSILSGAGGRPVALISGNLLSEGQVISGWTITRIGPREVVLTYKDRQETLTLE